MEALPSLDVDAETLTPEMRMARMLSAESLNLPDPLLPTDRGTEQMAAWSNTELKTWIEHKQARAEAARAELDRAAVQNHRQRIIAGALVGLVYEDLARVLLDLPVPAELDTEPEVAEVYRDVLARQATPYLMQAKLAYDACSGNAQQLEPMAHWSGFCGERSGQLPRVGQQHTGGAGQTTVTVVKP